VKYGDGLQYGNDGVAWQVYDEEKVLNVEYDNDEIRNHVIFNVPIRKTEI